MVKTELGIKFWLMQFMFHTIHYFCLPMFKYWFLLQIFTWTEHPTLSAWAWYGSNFRGGIVLIKLVTFIAHFDHKLRQFLLSDPQILFHNCNKHICPSLTMFTKFFFHHLLGPKKALNFLLFFKIFQTFQTHFRWNFMQSKGKIWL